LVSAKKKTDLIIPGAKQSHESGPFSIEGVFPVNMCGLHGKWWTQFMDAQICLSLPQFQP